MNKLPIAKESFVFIIFLGLLSVFFYLTFKPLSIATILILLFVLYFFRNPHRNVTKDKDFIVSPADGKIMSVSELYEQDFIGSKAIKVTIFLSLFNVHINRSPINGTVAYTQYRYGKFLPAFKSHVSEINERNTIGLEGDGIKVIVHQLTGFIARRIVCWSKKGDTLAKGERFGIIKFGSCTELIVPFNVDIKVKPGDKVKGGSTIIGVIK